MSAFPKPYADFVARLRVPGGFVLLAAFAYFSRPSVTAIEIGLPVSIVGLALRAWAAGCLAKNEQLASSGPYAYTRNPLYLGTLLVAAGLAIAARSLGLGVLFGVVFLLVYLPVIQLEEQHLRKLFSGYGAYAARVPAFWPRFSGPLSRLLKKASGTAKDRVGGLSHNTTSPVCRRSGTGLLGPFQTARDRCRESRWRMELGTGLACRGLFRQPAGETSSPFRFAMYVKNREYQASAAFLAATLFLFWKARG